MKMGAEKGQQGRTRANKGGPGEDTLTEMTSVKIPWGRGERGGQEFLQVKRFWFTDHLGILVVKKTGEIQKDFIMYLVAFKVMCCW